MSTQLITSALASSFPRMLEEVFQQLGLPYFMGGSQRFGYQRADSDTDLFVLLKDEETRDELVRDLESVGLESAEDSDHLYSQGAVGSHLLLVLPGVVHVMLLFEKYGYEWLRGEHEAVQRLLTEQPALRQYAQALGWQGVRGSLIYRALCALVPQAG